MQDIKLDIKEDMVPQEMQVSEAEAERRRQEWIGLFQKNKFQRQDIVHAQAIAHQTRQLYCVEILLDKVVTF